MWNCGRQGVLGKINTPVRSQLETIMRGPKFAINRTSSFCSVCCSVRGVATMAFRNLPQGDDETWHESLTYSEKVKIHLARALIMNPEVLVLQRPL